MGVSCTGVILSHIGGSGEVSRGKNKCDIRTISQNSVAARGSCVPNMLHVFVPTHTARNSGPHAEQGTRASGPRHKALGIKSCKRPTLVIT